MAYSFNYILRRFGGILQVKSHISKCSDGYTLNSNTKVYGDNSVNFKFLFFLLMLKWARNCMITANTLYFSSIQIHHILVFFEALVPILCE